MSLNTTVSMSTVSSVKESNDVLCRFPSQREREEFPDWLFKAEAFFAAKSLTAVVEQPVDGIGKYKNNIGEENDEDQDESEENNQQLSKTEKEKRELLATRSRKAYNYIIQSLNKKQIELVRNVCQGNAYLVMQVLKKTYGMNKSTSTTMTLFNKLNNIKKSSTESMSDYFARIDRMIYDLQVLESVITVNQKKYFVLAGLQDDPEWKSIIIAIDQLDSDVSWSLDKLQQYLIDQEEKKSITQTRKNDTIISDNNNISNNNTHAYYNHGRGGRGNFRGNFRGR